MKKRNVSIIGAFLAVCMIMAQIPAMAAGQHYMYNRYDGAAIVVNDGEEAAYAADYANPDETITLFSRVDGAQAVVWSYEVAGKQSYYATGLQNINMYSKYDGAMITVHSYEAAGYSVNYYGEKAQVTIYSTVDGASYTIWASELAAYLNVGYSLTKPYIAPKGYNAFPDVPSLGSMAGVADYPVYVSAGVYYYYNMDIVGWDAASRYRTLLGQWGFNYFTYTDNVDIYYNGKHFVGVVTVGNQVGVGVLY